jgi:hypothetical protein
MRRPLRPWPAVLLLLAAFAVAPAHAADSLAVELVKAAPAANAKVLELAARAADCARRQGRLDSFRHLAVIDYSLPSTQRRLWIFDVARGRLLFEELVCAWPQYRRESSRAVFECRRQQDVQRRIVPGD